MNQPLVGIIIPFFNGDNFIDKCLLSIVQSQYKNVKIYIIDNSDKPTQIDSISQQFPKTKVIKTQPAIGFAKANNIGADVASKEGVEVIFSFNQDACMDSKCIGSLVNALFNDIKIGIAAPILFTYNFKCIESHFIQYYLTQVPQAIFDAFEGGQKSYYAVAEVSGCCFAIRTNVFLEYGLFDPLYYMYLEDGDMCRRYVRVGMKCVLVPTAKVAHAHGNTNLKNQKKVMLYKRRSSFIYALKEQERPFFFNFLKIARDNFISYLMLILFPGNIKLYGIQTLLSFVVIDFKVLFILPKILKSRKYEQELIKENQFNYMNKAKLDEKTETIV